MGREGEGKAEKRLALGETRVKDKCSASRLRYG